MKLRIKGDSLRLRLTRGEVQQLAEAGSVEDQTHITSHGVLIYRLRRAARATELAATFENGAIDIQVPKAPRASGATRSSSRFKMCSATDR